MGIPWRRSATTCNLPLNSNRSRPPLDRTYKPTPPPRWSAPDSGGRRRWRRDPRTRTHRRACRHARCRLGFPDLEWDFLLRSRARVLDWISLLLLMFLSSQWRKLKRREFQFWHVINVKCWRILGWGCGHRPVGHRWWVAELNRSKQRAVSRCGDGPN